MSVSLFAYVCMLTAFTRHFPCCKTWWIKNLNLNYALLCQCFVGCCLSFSACCLLFLWTFSVVPSHPCPHTVSDPSPQPPLCCPCTCCGRFPFCVGEPCIDYFFNFFFTVFSLRTSETNYLNEAFSFYSAIRMRAYYSKASKEERYSNYCKSLCH